MSNVLSRTKTKNSKSSTGLLDQYIQKDTTTISNSNKHQSNVLSPPEEEKIKAKKATMKVPKEPTKHEDQTLCKDPNEELKNIIGPLVEEMKLLRETVHHDIKDLQNAVSQQKKRYI